MKRVLGLYGGGTMSVMFVTVLIAVYGMGVISGAAADPEQTLNETLIDVSNESYYTNASELESREARGPIQGALYNHTNVSKMPDLTPPSYDREVRKRTATLTNNMVRTALQTGNAGIRFGYANRGWIDPVWVGWLTNLSIFALYGGLLITYANRLRKSIP